MTIFTRAFFLLIFSSGSMVYAQKGVFSFVDKPDEKKIEVLYDGTLLTAYLYGDSLMKPVLFPVNTISGVTVTRGYPVQPRPGERVDHPHHIGLWLNYESVNGLDFWNNSTAIPYSKRPHYGYITHDRTVKKQADKNNATLEVTAQWKRHDKMPLLVEHTTYLFTVKDSSFMIDRTTTLRSLQEDVQFLDIKDGLLGIRVARELELPSEEPVKLVDSQGRASDTPVVDTTGVNGMYLSSEGLKGNDVWGTRARWVMLYGAMQKKKVSVTILDHRRNPGYPAYWHARGYGLFAVNPLGQKIFSEGKESLNLTVKKGEAITFRYRVVIHEGEPLTPAQLDDMATTFSRTH